MWHRPQLMTAIADLLIALAAAMLLVAGAVWLARLPWFALMEVEVRGELAQIRSGELERALAGHLRGSFFAVDVDAIRAAAERVSWVRRVQVRRQWPSRLQLEVEEHVAAARWGDEPGWLVNTHGEVFAALPPEGSHLPLMHGPSGSAPSVLARYADMQNTLARVGLQPAQLLLSSRLAWQLRLENGMVIELGRDQAAQPLERRLQRLVDHYPALLVRKPGRLATVDLRYSNGFALRYAAVNGKGKE